MKQSKASKTTVVCIAVVVLLIAGIICAAYYTGQSMIIATANAIGESAEQSAPVSEATTMTTTESIRETTERQSETMTEKMTTEKPENESKTTDKADESEDKAVTEEDGVILYHIQKGDTLTSISAKFGYSVDEIANFNEIRNVNKIYAGSVLRIPND